MQDQSIKCSSAQLNITENKMAVDESTVHENFNNKGGLQLLSVSLLLIKLLQYLLVTYCLYFSVVLMQETNQ